MGRDRVLVLVGALLILDCCVGVGVGIGVDAIIVSCWLVSFVMYW